MAARDATCAVAVLPDEARAAVPSGTLLYDAIRRAGVAADSPCGGQGRCGRCLVRVEGGDVSRRPNAHLAQTQVAAGWCLSCQTEVRGDVTVFVLPREAIDKVVVSGTAAIAAPSRAGRPRDPVVAQYPVRLPAPTLQDNASALERLRRALGSEHGIRRLEVDLPTLRGLEATLREGVWRASAVVEHPAHGGPSRLVAVRAGEAPAPSLGAAIDIGTTTVAVALVDLQSGRILDTATAYNRQVSCGEDVISRIVYSQRADGMRELQRLVRETMNDLLVDLCQRHDADWRSIYHVVVAGNTTMAHLALGLDPGSIRKEPYAPVATRFPDVTAAELGLRANPRASVFFAPAVAAYVGGDITAGILASGLHRRQGLAVFMDVGTNGEMALGNSEWMAACACSAGPAFEGAGVRCGTRAVAGAIEDVTIHYQTLEPIVRVIGGGAPRGICGSGMIAALAEMFVTGIIDKGGRFNRALVPVDGDRPGRIALTDHGPAYVLARATESATGEDILITEADIASIIHAKAAIYAGLTVMLRSLDIPVADIETVLIGGAFGQHINVEKSIIIGLLPDLPWDRFQFLGNTSAQGAYRVLVSRRARRLVEKVAGNVTYMELIADNAFMNEFTSSLFLPHTDMETFPSVKALLEQMERDRAAPAAGAGRAFR